MIVPIKIQRETAFLKRRHGGAKFLLVLSKSYY